MNKNTIAKLTASFDAIQQTAPDSDVEFWFARDLQPMLGYAQWRHFLEVIEKAKKTCENAGTVGFKPIWICKPANRNS